MQTYLRYVYQGGGSQQKESQEPEGGSREGSQLGERRDQTVVGVLDPFDGLAVVVD